MGCKRITLSLWWRSCLRHILSPSFSATEKLPVNLSSYRKQKKTYQTNKKMASSLCWWLKIGDEEQFQKSSTNLSVWTTEPRGGQWSALDPILHSWNKVQTSTFQGQGSFHSALSFPTDSWPVKVVVSQKPTPVWTHKSPGTSCTAGTIATCLCGAVIDRPLVLPGTPLLPTHMERKFKKCCFI